MSLKELILLSGATEFLPCHHTASLLGSMIMDQGGIPQISPLGYLKTCNTTIGTYICFDIFSLAIVGLDLGQCHFHTPF